MRKTRILALMLTVFALAACAVPATPRYDAAFGEALRQTQAMQTINPAAGANADPVAGVDAQAGKEAIGRYHESFKTPPQTFGVMGIGGSSTGGTQ